MWQCFDLNFCNSEYLKDNVNNLSTGANSSNKFRWISEKIGTSTQVLPI